LQTISNLFRLILGQITLGQIIVSSIIIFFIPSCVPKILIVEYPNLISRFYENKISSLESKEILTLEQKRVLIKTKIEYGFGILLEESDRLLDEDYQLGLNQADKAYEEFKDAKMLSISIINSKRLYCTSARSNILLQEHEFLLNMMRIL